MDGWGWTLGYCESLELGCGRDEQVGPGYSAVRLTEDADSQMIDSKRPFILSS